MLKTKPETTMSIVFSPNFFALFIIVSSLFFSNGYAGAFKCVDKKGDTIFQDSPCAGGKKQTKIELSSTHNISIPQTQCTEICQSSNQICVAELSAGKKNIENISHCEKAKLECIESCIDRGLEELGSIENSTYERELRHKRSLEREARYQAFWEKRDNDREKKRSQKNCRKYQKRLAKIKRKWERKQRAGWKPKDEERYLIKIENAEDAMKIECR